MANVIYNSLKEGLLNSSVDLVNDTIKVLFVEEYNITNEIVTSASELSATVSFGGASSSATPLTEIAISGGYTSEGYTLTNKVISASSTVGTFYYTADSFTVSASSLTVGGYLLYKYTGDINTSIPLGYIDQGIQRVSSNGNFKIQWPSQGIISMESSI